MLHLSGWPGNWEDGDDPWREHAKWFPECEFLQSKKSSEEIEKYIENYSGFVRVVVILKGSRLLSAAYNLGVLNLEELILPAVKGIKSAAKPIVQQCLHPLHLRCFSFILCLDDDSLLDMAKVAMLEKLSLLVNYDVTETGWRNVFRTLNNMPAFKELDISCMFTHQIKASASTVTASVQCVLMPGLVTTVMVGWLLDAEDLKTFDITKEQHPHSRSLKLSCKWVLPLSPIFQD
ncbi:LOW QUALITY PROTEIN: baculoviral IAP repeat-containing protein 1-like [Ciconia maguari]